MENGFQLAKLALNNCLKFRRWLIQVPNSNINGSIAHNEGI